jgi:RNA polymerase sigma factor (sigma-70 family)
MSLQPFKNAFSAQKHEGATDQALVAACLKGEASAWDALIKRYAALIYSVGMRAGLSESEREDLFQDVCLILLDHLSDLRDTARLAGWLISTTKREAWRRQKKRGAKLASELGEGEWAMEGAASIHAPPASSPEADILALENQQLMREALTRLADRCRHLLTLLYGTEEPPSYAEISEQCNLPVGSIGPTRARCLQQLRKLLLETGF